MQAEWEVEQKYIVDDMVTLQTNLAAQGFEWINSEVNSDIYFRHPCRDLRATDEAFRLRTVDDRCCVTYKGKRLPGPVKTRPEIELDVTLAERERWLEMLQHLGFKPLPAVNKRRQNFAYAGKPVYPGIIEAEPTKIHVTIDEVELLGYFAELELIITEQSQLDLAASHIQQLACRLGLVSVQPRSYLSLTLEKLGVE